MDPGRPYFFENLPVSNRDNCSWFKHPHSHVLPLPHNETWEVNALQNRLQSATPYGLKKRAKMKRRGVSPKYVEFR